MRVRADYRVIDGLLLAFHSGGADKVRREIKRLKRSTNNPAMHEVLGKLKKVDCDDQLIKDIEVIRNLWSTANNEQN